MSPYRVNHVGGIIVSKKKKTSETTAPSAFKPKWSEPSDTGWRSADYQGGTDAGGLGLLMTKDGRVTVKLSPRGRPVQLVNAVLFVRHYNADASFRAYCEEQCAMAKVADASKTTKKPSASKGGGYFYADDGRSHECTEKEMQNLIDCGHITPDTPVIVRGMDKWVPASKCEPVGRMFEQKIPPPPPA